MLNSPPFDRNSGAVSRRQVSEGLVGHNAVWWLVTCWWHAVTELNDTTSATTEQIVLSVAEKARIARRARLDLIRVLVSQVAASVVVAIVFFWASGPRGGVSALLGAACYLAPNAVFVLRLLLATLRPQGAGAGTFLIGNMLKVLVAVGLLWLLADQAADRVDWLAAVVGLIAALKGYWIGLMLSGGRLAK